MFLSFNCFTIKKKKRVSTSKIPRYRSTTSINAVEDIQSEMAPDDVYVPMAARIKLFEKGLGNGSNKPAPIVSNINYYAFNLNYV